MENKYTLENIPSEIKDDQFYAFNKRNGDICIGTIFGKSTLTGNTLIELFGSSESAYKIEENDSWLQKGYIFCSKHFQTFVNEYTKYKEEKAKKAKSKKKIYAVNRRTFRCRATVKGYTILERLFENKQEAIEYSNKGIKTLKKQVPYYIDELNKLLTIVKEISKNIAEIDYFPSNIVKPSTLKVNDLLLKIVNEKSEDLRSYFTKVKEDYIVTVKSFITPDTAKLSDGTLLIENECYLTVPSFIKYEEGDKVREFLKKEKINKIIHTIETFLKHLDKINKHIDEEYIPLKSKTTPFEYGYFVPKELRKFIKELKTQIENNSL